MRKSSLVPVALALVALFGWSGLASAQLGQFVQAKVDAFIADGDDCRTRILYSVPAGKRLRIDWMSVETAEFGGDDFDPIDVFVETRLNNVLLTHNLVRLDGAEFIGSSFFRTQLWSSPVTLYSQGNRNVLIRACRDVSTDVTSVIVTFHGQLFDE